MLLFVCEDQGAEVCCIVPRVNVTVSYGMVVLYVYKDHRVWASCPSKSLENQPHFSSKVLGSIV